MKKSRDRNCARAMCAPPVRLTDCRRESMNINLKGTVGDKIAIIAEITQVLIDQSGVTYGIKVEANDEFKWVEDGSGIIAWDQDSIKEEEKDDDRIAIPQPKVKPEKVKKEKVKTTLGTNVPKQPTEPPMPKKRPGRPRKATVEGAMAKLTRMKHEEIDKALDELERARENDD